MNHTIIMLLRLIYIVITFYEKCLNLITIIGGNFLSLFFKDFIFICLYNNNFVRWGNLYTRILHKGKGKETPSIQHKAGSEWFFFF